MIARRIDAHRAITGMLSDGAWHVVEDLRDVTKWPAEWVDELAAEGVIETGDQVGNTLVRLKAREAVPS